jgi:hypothetical protein
MQELDTRIRDKLATSFCTGTGSFVTQPIRNVSFSSSWTGPKMQAELLVSQDRNLTTRDLMFRKPPDRRVRCGQLDTADVAIYRLRGVMDEASAAAILELAPPKDQRQEDLYPSAKNKVRTIPLLAAWICSRMP